MKNFILMAIAVSISSYFIPGVSIVGGFTLEGIVNLSLVVLVLAAANMFIKPILSIITLPINIVTLGLFSLVINAFLIKITDWVLTGFQVNSFLSAIIFSLIISIIRMVLESFED